MVINPWFCFRNPWFYFDNLFPTVWVALPVLPALPTTCGTILPTTLTGSSSKSWSQRVWCIKTWRLVHWCIGSQSVVRRCILKHMDVRLRNLWPVTPEFHCCATDVRQSLRDSLSCFCPQCIYSHSAVFQYRKLECFSEPSVSSHACCCLQPRCCRVHVVTTRNPIQSFLHAACSSQRNERNWNCPRFVPFCIVNRSTRNRPFVVWRFSSVLSQWRLFNTWQAFGLSKSCCRILVLLAWISRAISSRWSFFAGTWCNILCNVRGCKFPIYRHII